MKPILLVIRPNETADAFAAKVVAEIEQPITVIKSPALKIVPITPTDIPPADHLIFTSANGVQQAMRLGLQSSSAFCVGTQTTNLANGLGFAAQKAGNTAQELIAAIQTTHPQGTLLHVSGRHTRGEIAQTLRASGLNADRLITYDQTLLSLTEAANEAFAGTTPIVLPVFSPRSARLVADVKAKGPVFCIAISGAVKDALSPDLRKRCEVVATPDEKSMVTATVAALARTLRTAD